MGSKQLYQSTTSLSFGDFSITLKPSSEFQGDQHRPANDAALNAAMAIVPWTTDNAVEPKPKDGKQRQFVVDITDGSRLIAAIEFDVPTTASFGLGMYQTYVGQTIKPAVLQAYRSFPSTRANQQQPTGSPSNQHLAEDALSAALDRGRDITPKQLTGSNR